MRIPDIPDMSDEELGMDEEEMAIMKLGSLVSMINDGENLNNVSFMVKLAENPSLMKVLMRMLGGDTMFEACRKLLYYNSKAINSKIIRNKFVDLMKANVDKGVSL